MVREARIQITLMLSMYLIKYLVDFESAVIFGFGILVYYIIKEKKP